MAKLEMASHCSTECNIDENRPNVTSIKKRRVPAMPKCVWDVRVVSGDEVIENLTKQTSLSMLYKLLGLGHTEPSPRE